MTAAIEGPTSAAGPPRRPRPKAGRDRSQASGLREVCLLLTVVYLGIIGVSLLAGGSRLSLEIGAALAAVFALLAPVFADRGHDRVPSRFAVVVLSLGLGTALIGAGLRGNNGFVLLGLGTLIGVGMAARARARLGYVVALMSPFALEAVAGSPGVKAALIAVLLLVATCLVSSACITAPTLLKVAVGGSAVYITAATVLYAGGVRSSYVESYTGKFATYGGFFAERWRFPLSNTWVTVPIVATFVLVGACALWGIARRTRDQRSTTALAKSTLAVIAAIAAFDIIAANGRTNLLIAVVGCVFGLIRPTRLARFVALGAQMLWFAPFIWQALVINNPAIGALVQTVIPNRQHTSFNAATLEGRSTIWELSVQAIARGTWVDKALGFGPDGYIASGASQQYLTVLAPGYRAGYYPPHNAVLEILFNAGFIALLLMACIYFVIMVRPAWKGNTIPLELRRAHLALLIVAPGLAFTEVAFVPSNGTPAVAVLYLTFAFAILAPASLGAGLQGQDHRRSLVGRQSDRGES